MLSIGKLTAGREDYYLSSLTATADEYYLSVTEIPGVWHGALAETLGLGGSVDAEAFRSVLDGRRPDGTALVPGAGDRERVTGFDLTFSGPKSVSLLWALSSPEISAAVVAAHDAAVADAFDALESEAVFARRGHGGTTRIVGQGLVAAAFGHRTSRSGDPQLHTHLVTANLTLGSDGRWSGPDGRAVYGWARTTGYLYQAALRARLTETLGVNWTPVHKGVAEIEGVSAAQRESFSARRAEITAELARLGYSGPRAARTATLTTRPAKDHSVDLGELREQWSAQAASVGLDVAALTTGREPRQVHHHDLERRLLSPEGLTANATSFDRRHVLQALAAGHSDGARSAQPRGDADRLVRSHDVVALRPGTAAGGPRHTTAELLTVEARLIEGALARRSAGVAVVADPVLGHALAERATLSDEQKEMITRLVTSGAGVEVVVGRAGTGKTFALDAARAAWQSSGHAVIGTALAARAAAELQAGAGIPSTTLDRLLLDLEGAGPLGALASRSVIVVDEAGMVGTRKLDRLLTHARRCRAKVVLVGDPRQLPEIDAGGTLAALAKRLGSITLVANRRQQNPWERDALDQLRSGSVPDAVAAYERAGRITFTPSAEASRQALVDDWWSSTHSAHWATAAGVSEPGGRVVTAAMYALSRADVADLNARARIYRRHHGALHGPDVRIAGRDFAVGDDVLALRNDRRLGVRNGTTGVLVDITPTAAVIDTHDGQVTLPGDYLSAGYLTHGYATTIHKAQGATVDHAYLLGSDQLFREAGYVGLSRGRSTNRLYVVEPAGPRFNDPGITRPETTRPGITRPEPVTSQLSGEPRPALGEIAATLTTSRAQTAALDQLPIPPSDTGPLDRRAALADPPPPGPSKPSGHHRCGDPIDRLGRRNNRIATYRHAFSIEPEEPVTGRGPGRQPTGPLVADATSHLRQARAAVAVGAPDAVVDAIGHEPDDPDQRRAWTVARLTITQAREHLLQRDLDQGLSR